MRMLLVLVLLLGAGTVTAVSTVRCRRAVRGLYRAERLAAGREFDLTRTELAYLAGNLGAMTVTTMHEGGRLVATRSGDVTLTTPAAAGTWAGTGAGDRAGNDFEEVAVGWLRSAHPNDLRLLLRVVDTSPEAKALRARLAVQGLAYDEELVERVRWVDQRKARLAGALAAMLVAALEWPRAFPGLWPIPLAVLLPSLAAAFWITCVSTPPLRTTTGPGERVLKAALAAEPRRRGTAAVALRGLTALPADHDLRTCAAASDKRSREARRQEYFNSCSGYGCGE
ncbi:hypothetical protein [Streptomyces sp. NRRL WC-3742]|uniref:hypothetical protein n=1 Tax=Streptomyces sp. NRRL WC-3742 TaxID=1463934 RepID=UPI0004C5D75B|nr:hypothetical protein [Streptomyces sp. NRRL WC-3742]